LGKDIPDSRILCVGDGILTDIDGAIGEDLDSLFITGGLAASRNPDHRTTLIPKALVAYLTKEMRQPTYCIGKLR
jgi:ribonucleotide monophosphatase NagD (HAD superfamily)